MGQSINGYDIIFQAVVGEQKKLFAGTKSNNFNLNPKGKELPSSAFYLKLKVK